MKELILGRLSLDAMKHDLIEYGAGVSMLVGAIVAIALITYYKKWTWLWREWLTSVDHKKIGVMYLVVSFVMLFKGFIDALMMRAQQAISVGESFGYLSSTHYQQIFTAHGTTMIFFVGMGVIFALINIIVPLQIGARDVAFPFLNSLSFWLFAVSAAFINLSLIVGNFSAAGWLAYPPLSGIVYSPDVGVDYWLWILQISGLGSSMTGINFLVTILKMRCPGMTLMKMPLFTWSALASVILVVFAFPILTATLGMLSFDRLLGMHIFTPEAGGNPMMFVNLIWSWGHPEVYILVLPAFGIFSEVVATFSEKRLFGYPSMVWAIGAITVLSFIVWLHHFFTMGAGANVNAFFGIMTMLIAVPTGVKIFNWLFTMYRGRVHFTSPMLWFLGFVIAFTVGGAAGVLLSVPPIDFQAHNSLFLIAHFHSMVLPGVLFGFFAGFTYWFPKIWGFRLNDTLGKWAFWHWLIGFLVAFLPLYLLGFMGATRRLDHYDTATGWQPLFVVAAVGALLMAIGVGFQLLQIFISWKRRDEYRDTTGDPWNGRTLEWATTSPPPFYNFAIIPEVHDRDPFWAMKKSHTKPQRPFHDILMPKNTPYGIYIGLCSALLMFGMVWYIWWMAVLGFLGGILCLVIHLSDDHVETILKAADIARIENRT